MLAISTPVNITWLRVGSLPVCREKSCLLSSWLGVQQFKHTFLAKITHSTLTPSHSFIPVNRPEYKVNIHKG